jgi:phospholipid/cholesterol/gamma-HCH transport system permease protein
VAAKEQTLLTPVIAFLTFAGETWLIFVDSARRLFKGRFEVAETINQMAFIGVASVPIVILTGFFSGAVLSLYLSQFLGQYGATQFVGATVGLSVTREIGPVLAGIMVSARCGSAMAAQLGTMAVTEQIDALKMLSVHPTNYLVIPRVVASVTMVPILALVCMWAGVIGGMLIAMIERIPITTFMVSMERFIKPYDFLAGLVKAPFFGLLIALVACQQGLRTKQGAVGVGRATTNTVVISMVLVYVANFVIARVLFGAAAAP